MINELPELEIAKSSQILLFAVICQIMPQKKKKKKKKKNDKFQLLIEFNWKRT